MHQSADPDAVGSAAALANLLTLRSKVDVQIFAESLNRSAKNVADAFNLLLAAPTDLAKHSTIIMVDLNNVEQMGTLAPHLPKKDATTFCVDHHVPHKDLPKLVDFSLYDDEICSTAELVLQLWEASGHSPSADASTLLACGLVYDSRHFHIATNKTFEHFLSRT